MLTALLSLSVLGVGGVRWITFAPDKTPVTVYQLYALYLNTTYAPLARLYGMS